MVFFLSFLYRFFRSNNAGLIIVISVSLVEKKNHCYYYYYDFYFSEGLMKRRGNRKFQMKLISSFSCKIFEWKLMHFRSDLCGTDEWRLSKYVHINRIKSDLIWFNLTIPNNKSFFLYLVLHICLNIQYQLFTTFSL